MILKQYEAAKKFAELVNENPQDFTATVDQGREHLYYEIRNRYRAVGAIISVDSSGKPMGTVKNSSSNIGFNYMEEDVQQFLLDWAVKYLLQKKVDEQIEQDNVEIDLLVQYYNQ